MPACIGVCGGGSRVLLGRDLSGAIHHYFLREQPFDNSGIREFGSAGGARTNVKIVMNFKC